MTGWRQSPGVYGKITSYGKIVNTTFETLWPPRSKIRTSVEHDLTRYIVIFEEWGEKVKRTPGRKSKSKPSLPQNQKKVELWYREESGSIHGISRLHQEQRYLPVLYSPPPVCQYTWPHWSQGEMCWLFWTMPTLCMQFLVVESQCCDIGSLFEEIDIWGNVEVCELWTQFANSPYCCCDLVTTKSYCVSLSFTLKWR